MALPSFGDKCRREITEKEKRRAGAKLGMTSDIFVRIYSVHLIALYGAWLLSLTSSRTMENQP